MRVLSGKGVGYVHAASSTKCSPTRTEKYDAGPLYGQPVDDAHVTDREVVRGILRLLEHEQRVDRVGNGDTAEECTHALGTRLDTDAATSLRRHGHATRNRRRRVSIPRPSRRGVAHVGGP